MRIKKNTSWIGYSSYGLLARVIRVPARRWFITCPADKQSRRYKSTRETKLLPEQQCLAPRPSALHTRFPHSSPMLGANFDKSSCKGSWCCPCTNLHVKYQSKWKEYLDSVCVAQLYRLVDLRALTIIVHTSAEQCWHGLIACDSSVSESLAEKQISLILSLCTYNTSRHEVVTPYDANKVSLS